MRRVAWIAAWFTALSLASVHGQATQPTPTIDGTVVSPDSTPVVGAKVLIYDMDAGSASPPLASVLTDSKGRFTLPFGPERCDLIVQDSGYALYAGRLLPGLDEGPVQVRLKPATTVRLIVLDMDGKPAPGVQVCPQTFTGQFAGAAAYGIPRSLSMELSQTTNNDGMCNFPNMPQSSAVQFDYINARVSFSATSVRTGSESLTQALPLRVETSAGTGSIEGKVIKADSGEPVAHALVRGTMRVPRSRSSIGRNADDNGFFRIAPATPGDYWLAAELDSPLSASYVAQPVSFTLAVGEQVRDVELKLIKGLRIHGKVTDAATGKPILDATLHVNPDPFDFEIVQTVSASTSADGTFELCVPPGHYSIQLFNLGRHGYLLPSDNKRIVTVDADHPDVTVNFECQSMPSPAVKGLVVDEQGKPIAGAGVNTARHNEFGGSGVSIYAPQEYTGGNTITDMDGRFVLPFISDKAELQVRKAGMRLPKPVTIDADHRDLKLVLAHPPPSSVVSHVVDDSGQPVAEATVVLRWFDEMMDGQRIGTTDANGDFRAGGLDANFTCNITASAPHLAPSSTMRLTLQPGKPVETSIRLLHAEGVITGTLLDDAGQPMPGMALRPRNGGTPTRTDMAGHFRIEDIPGAGPVQIWIGEDVLTDSIGASSMTYQAPLDVQDLRIVYKPSSPPNRVGRVMPLPFRPQ